MSGSARLSDGAPPHQRAPPQPSVTSVLESIPSRCRRTNTAVLDDPVTPLTWLVTVTHSFIALGHVLFLVVRSQGERMANDAGGVVAGTITWTYIAAAMIHRKKLHRLHKEIVHYCKLAQIDTDPVMKTLPKQLQALWRVQTVGVIVVWAFYTLSPFLFELIHGYPLGSLRRLSIMVWPTPCDLEGETCYWIMYTVVAVEWFFGAYCFSSVESLIMVYYILVSSLFEQLGESIRKCGLIKIEWSKDHDGGDSSTKALRRCIKQHQFLLGWSKEITHVFGVAIFLRMGCMVVLMALALLKTVLSEHFILDEVPFIGVYGTQSIYIICKLADELYRTSSEVSTRAYEGAWEMANPRERQDLTMVQLRAQQPVHTRAGLLNNVRLQTFVEIINRSYTALQAIRASRQQ